MAQPGAENLMHQDEAWMHQGEGRGTWLSESEGHLGKSTLRGHFPPRQVWGIHKVWVGSPEGGGCPRRTLKGVCCLKQEEGPAGLNGIPFKTHMLTSSPVM